MTNSSAGAKETFLPKRLIFWTNVKVIKWQTFKGKG